MMPDFTVPEVLAVLGVFLAGGFVKGTLGFGLPLTTMAALPLITGVEAALAVNVLVLPFANVVQFMKGRLDRETLYAVRFLLAGLVAGIPVGTMFVTSVDESMLMVVLGFFVIVFTAVNGMRPGRTAPGSLRPGAGVAVGFAAGIVGALSAVNGPIFVMYLAHLHIERARFMPLLGLLFAVSGILISAAFWSVGIMDLQRLFLAAVSLPAALVGMSIGNRIGRRFSAERFRWVMLLALSVLGANLVFQGVESFLVR